MAKPPSIELIEATHTFPGQYVIKVIGRNSDEFLAQVLAGVREAMGSDLEPAFHTREAEGGRHLAVTLELKAQNAAQVHEVYTHLLTVPGVVLLL